MALYTKDAESSYSVVSAHCSMYIHVRTLYSPVENNCSNGTDAWFCG